MTLLSRVLNHHPEKGSKPHRSSPASLAKHRNKKASLCRAFLTIELESPPVVLYGQAHESTGSIISGVLTLDIQPLRPHAASFGLPAELTPQTSNSLQPFMSASSLSSATSLRPSVTTDSLQTVDSGEKMAEVDSVTLLLIQTTHYTKPFVASVSGSCKSCATRKATLAQWDVLLQKSMFPAGSHAYPFSHLLPGLVAASTKLGSLQCASFIKYDLVATAVCDGQESSLILPINILRSILRGPDRNSLRVFPPTEITANAVLPGVMYPKSTFPIEIRMSHVVNSKQDRRWRMRKLLWKLEEHTLVAAHACESHKSKLKALEESQKRAQHYKALKTGVSPGASPSAGGSDGPSKSGGLHHLTIHTLMFVGRPPSSPQVVTAAPNEPNQPITGNQDIVEPDVEAPTNRVSDEVVRFEEDFGASHASPNGSSRELGGTARRASNENFDILETAKESLFLDEIRVVAHGDIKSGWKSDFSGDGSIELVAEIQALNCSSGFKHQVTKATSNDAKPDDIQEGLRNDANISCDINDSTLGIYVSHILVLEVIVAEEVVQAPKGGHARDGLTPVTSSNSVAGQSNLVGVPTGAARVLRMQFKVVVTERSGLGVAWDDEVPPMYEDVRALSPPVYETQGTPSSIAQGMSPSLVQTPAVIYGLGATPVAGAFAQNPSIDRMIDLDDQIQELQI